MRKLALIKWKPGFEYSHSTHSCSPIRLADVTSVLAHFKFFSHLKEFSKSEVKRNARISNSSDWKVYAKTLTKEDVNFFDPDISLPYRDSHSLLNARFMSSCPQYFEFVERQLTDSKRGQGNRLIESKKLTELAKLSDTAIIDYADYMMIWPSISLFSLDIEGDTKSRQMLLRFEKDMQRAASSTLWRASYPLRRAFSKIGLTDQRSLTEETYDNQSLHAKFTFVYGSIWWDVLGPFRAVYKILRKIKLVK